MDTETQNVGRPTILTERVQEIIVGAVENGATYRLACLAANVSIPAFTGWRRKGETGEEPYATFVAAIEAAEARHANRMMSVLNRLSDGAKDERLQHDAAKSVLSMRYSADYGKQQVDVAVSGTIATVRVEIPDFDPTLSMEERLAMLRAVGGHDK